MQGRSEQVRSGKTPTLRPRGAANRAVRLASTAVESASALIYPSHCAGCGRLLMPGQNWCSRCWPALVLACRRDYCPACGNSLGPHHHIDQGRCRFCGDIPNALQGICRLGSYESALSESIKTFKYKQNYYTGRMLAHLLADVLMEQDWFDQVDIIVPIPSHWVRRMMRRFSHTKVLAEEIYHATTVPTLALLKSTRPTQPQVGMPAGKRRENLKGAFKPVRRFPIKGAVACLVDDVMTTGSTVCEAARTLTAAGADTVYAAVIARSTLDHDG